MTTAPEVPPRQRPRGRGGPCPAARVVSAVRTTRRNECGSGGAGGTFTYFLRPTQKIEGRQQHERARNAERDRGAVPAQENGHEQRGEERAEIDRPIERVVDDLREMLVGPGELVAHERRNERLDAAGPDGDERKPCVEARAVVVEQREARVTRDVHQREPEDRAVLAEEPVGDPAAEQREEVHADNEGVENLLRDAGALRLRRIEQQRPHEKGREDVAHPIEAEALAGLVADDVRNLSGQARARGGGRAGQRFGGFIHGVWITPGPCRVFRACRAHRRRSPGGCVHPP